MAFELPELPYPYDALEPYIDRTTMEIHHTRHHGGYVNKLNAAIKGTEWEGKTIEEILANVSRLPASIRNNGGGHWNHSLFWQVMSPKGGGEPTGKVREAIERDFGSFENFREVFTQAALGRFGSGWAWLIVKEGGKLHVCSTPNQDNPLMDVVDEECRGTPILGLDVWEHAYYLKYQWRRNEYVEAWWNVVNWDEVNRRYEELTS